MILTPWNNPSTFTRAWCLFEIYCTIITESKFDITMSNKENIDFFASIRNDSNNFFLMLSTIDIKNSESWIPDDRIKIFDVIEKNRRRL